MKVRPFLRGNHIPIRLPCLPLLRLLPRPLPLPFPRSLLRPPCRLLLQVFRIRYSYAPANRVSVKVLTSDNIDTFFAYLAHSPTVIHLSTSR